MAGLRAQCKGKLGLGNLTGLGEDGPRLLITLSTEDEYTGIGDVLQWC